MYRQPTPLVAILLASLGVARPLAAQVDWYNLDQRTGHAVVADLQRQSLVLFGGAREGGTLLDDTWETSAGGWRRQSPTKRPSARRGHTMGFLDSGQNFAAAQVVLFGGIDWKGFTNDTWLFNGSSWVLVDPATKPPARTHHAIAYDSKRRVLVMFGGQGLFTLDDHWEWDGKTWVDRKPQTRPGGRWGHAMAYDPVRDRIVLFGGNGSLQDMWEYDSARNLWAEVRPNSVPPGRFGHAMVYDGTRVLLFGGNSSAGLLRDTWLYDHVLKGWQPSSSSTAPEARTGHTLALDPKSKHVILLGGEDAAQSPTVKVWWWDPQILQWYRPMEPSPRWGAMVAYHAARQEVVMFGGNAELRWYDTWIWNGGTWQQKSLSTRPPGRVVVGAYDALRQRIVALPANQDITSESCTSWSMDEAWEWDGARWIETQSNGPRRGCAAAMAYDPERRHVVLLTTQGETWTWDGQAWARSSPATTPPNRIGAGLAYDPVGRSLLLFGGYSYSQRVPLADTWRWTGSTWQQLQPSLSPSPRTQMGIVTDTRRGLIVLFGGAAPGSPDIAYDDTWEWDGASWVLRKPVSKPPTSRAFHGMTYDDARGEVVLFGGYTTRNGRLDPDHQILAGTWFYAPVDPASHSVIGPGCRGTSGSLASLQVQALPWIGSTFVVDVHNVQEALIPLAFLGFFKLSPPLHMWMFGPDCYVYATSDFIFYPPADYKLKTARLSLPIPNASVFVGHRLYTQAALVRLLPRIGLGYSDAIEARIGAK